MGFAFRSTHPTPCGDRKRRGRSAPTGRPAPIPLWGLEAERVDGLSAAKPITFRQSRGGRHRCRPSSPRGKPESHPAAKRGIRPVPYSRRVTLFHRVKVNVIEMVGKIVLVTQRMLPIPPLPNATFAFGASAGGERFAARQTVRDCGFDETPARGEIHVVLGQSPDRMQVIGQYDSSFDGEGMTRPHVAKRCPQQADVLGKQPAPTLGQIDREEIAAAVCEIAPIRDPSCMQAGRMIRWVSLRLTHPTATAEYG